MRNETVTHELEMQDRGPWLLREVRWAMQRRNKTTDVWTFYGPAPAEAGEGKDALLGEPLADDAYIIPRTTYLATRLPAGAPFRVLRPAVAPPRLHSDQPSHTFRGKA
jgi:hypothetical protein